MLTVTFADCDLKAPCAECHYAECRYAECRYAECHFAECRGAITHSSVKWCKHFTSVTYDCVMAL